MKYFEREPTFREHLGIMLADLNISKVKMYSYVLKLIGF